MRALFAMKPKSWVAFGVLGIASALVVTLVASNLSGSESLASSPECAPGQVSHLNVPRVPPDAKERRTTPVIVLACGTDPSHERFELVAFGIGSSTCVSVDHPKQRETRIVLCKPSKVSWLACQSDMICLNSPGVAASPTGIRTELTGQVAAEANTVRIEYRQNGKARSTHATLGKINGPILKKLDIDQAGGVFIGVLPECVPPKKIHVTVLDRHGHRLARKRSTSAFVQSCTGAKRDHSTGYHLILEP